LPWKLFGFWPVENLFGYAFMTLFVVVFYEHFLDDERDPRLSRRHAKLFLFALVVVAAMIIAYALDPLALQFSHAYVYGGIAAILFPIMFGIYNPKIIPKFATLTAFFFLVWLLLEIVGVRLGNWAFPENGFIGHAASGILLKFSG
jgi:Na+/proline symporter